ncbi:MAG: UDP-N-acetylglucosamine 2-epimerase (non-hydrolyzing) [Planctomycetes bacterium]|nr:UDP-N-acetylglucosamine 2-epimerase (non-hydrolyzing) [Planctomycetota bacterium]
MKIVTVVGARPQFIKAAAVSRAVAKHNRACPDRCIEERIVHTGQHYDNNMSQVFFDELEIPKPDYHLGVSGGGHGVQTGRMLEQLEPVVMKEGPDLILVYGDTNSTLAGALVAAKLHVPLAHVEAGLRSFNRRMPEEINRVLTDHVSDYLFCPTETARKNLVREGITSGIYECGDVMMDCILYYRSKAQGMVSNLLEEFRVQAKSYYLATIHRAENTDDADRLRSIFSALGEISTRKNPTLVPLHPRTKKKLSELEIVIPEHIRILPPISYLQMIALEGEAVVILTDSGGVQKEAYMHKVPCITLRDETEWVETVQSGWNVLAGADRPRMVAAVEQAERTDRTEWKAFYGDGDASNQIISNLL